MAILYRKDLKLVFLHSSLTPYKEHYKKTENIYVLLRKVCVPFEHAFCYSTYIFSLSFSHISYWQSSFSSNNEWIIFHILQDSSLFYNTKKNFTSPLFMFMFFRGFNVFEKYLQKEEKKGQKKLKNIAHKNIGKNSKNSKKI